MLMDKKNMTAAYERAESTRIIEYLRCMNEDAFINERFVQIEMADKNYNESVDTKENREILMNLKVESDEDKEEEIKRIIDATHDLDIDEMIGIQKSVGDYEMNVFVEGANLDLIVNVKSQIPEMKKKLKSAKKKINQKDYDSAKKDLKDIISKCEKLKSYVKETEDTSLEKLIGAGFLLGIDGWVTLFISFGLTSFGLLNVIKASTLAYKEFFTINELSVLTNTPKAIKIKNEIAKLNKNSAIFSTLGIISSIVSYLDVAIKASKSIEGYAKMIDKDMDDKGWWKYLTSNGQGGHNSYRSYIYQILDETAILAKRYISSIDKLKKLNEN